MSRLIFCHCFKNLTPVKKILPPPVRNNSLQYSERKAGTHTNDKTLLHCQMILYINRWMILKSNLLLLFIMSAPVPSHQRQLVPHNFHTINILQNVQV